MKRKSWLALGLPGFTLVELIVVMVILCVLLVILLKTYSWISTMVFRVQQEKEVSQEILQISQVVQNFSDRNSVDYALYTQPLSATQWIVDVLYLSGQDWSLSLFSSGECVDPADSFIRSWDSVCSLYAHYQGKDIQLTNPKKIALSKVIFKIIPFAPEQEYLNNSSLCPGNYFYCLSAPWFRMFFKAYSVNYGSQWATNVVRSYELFY